VSTPAVHEYGLHTLYDLDALPEDGRRYELADRWLAELPASPWHDHGADGGASAIEAIESHIRSRSLPRRAYRQLIIQLPS
jgi:hypothetical protein